MVVWPIISMTARGIGYVLAVAKSHRVIAQ
jgi:hypothetical protein